MLQVTLFQILSAALPPLEELYNHQILLTLLGMDSQIIWNKNKKEDIKKHYFELNIIRIKTPSSYNFDDTMKCYTERQHKSKAMNATEKKNIDLKW